MEGEPGLTLTGQLGDVMKESAQIALSYLRSNGRRLGIDPNALAGRRIHVHVPAGAVPKDGPSAGITMVTALASLVTGRPVRPEVGMTGEVTLSGRVLPIGGVKQKLLAAHRAGLTEVIIPKRNEPDLDDVPDRGSRGADHPHPRRRRRRARPGAAPGRRRRGDPRRPDAQRGLTAPLAERAEAPGPPTGGLGVRTSAPVAPVPAELPVAPLAAEVPVAALAPVGAVEAALAAPLAVPIPAYGGLAALDRACRAAPAITSSAAPTGTSTSENRSAISIEPMSRPFSPVSPVIAPTRSCGRTPARRPSPTNTAWRRRRYAAGPRRAGARRPAARPGPGLPLRPDRDLRDLLLVVGAGAGRLVGQLHRGQRDLHQVELVGERLDDHPERGRGRPRAGSPAARPGSAPAGGRAGRRPSGPCSIGDPLRRSTRSMVLSIRCSRGSARVIATPSRPARPTRPIRCTYDSGADGTS